MKILAIILYLFGASHAIPVLLGVVNPNIPQGGAMNLFVPGMYQPPLQQKIAGLPQIPFNARSGLNAQLPNQVMSYVVPYGIPQKQGQMQIVPLYPAQQQPAQASPKQLGNEPPIEQVFGCIVPQLNGEVVMPASGLQLPTKNPDDLLGDVNPTLVPNNQEDKVTTEVIRAP
ncbi:odontogenic ameloblast-associated protein isoform X3 [Dendropsophus ebraccatus]|uniref:odontogenic ameloblast-associated protein isoform X3 n=1 Tax=Dendropsophus ebraccatus TaxID=150705 RepID=UPI0038321F7A